MYILNKRVSDWTAIREPSLSHPWEWQVFHFPRLWQYACLLAGYTSSKIKYQRTCVIYLVISNNTFLFWVRETSSSPFQAVLRYPAPHGLRCLVSTTATAWATCNEHLDVNILLATTPSLRSKLSMWMWDAEFSGCSTYKGNYFEWHAPETLLLCGCNHSPELRY